MKFTARIFILLEKNMLYSKLRCQETFESKVFSCKILLRITMNFAVVWWPNKWHRCFARAKQRMGLRLTGLGSLALQGWCHRDCVRAFGEKSETTTVRFSSTSVCVGSPIWRGRALVSSKVDGCEPHTQRVNLKVVGQPA